MELFYIDTEINKIFRTQLKDDYYEITEKAKKKLLPEFISSNILFSYDYSNAWERKIETLEVFLNNTVVVSSPNYRVIYYSISDETLNSIADIIRKYSHLFRSEEFCLEELNVLDGNISRIKLFDGVDYYYCSYYCFASNIISHKEIWTNAYKFVSIL